MDSGSPGEVHCCCWQGARPAGRARAAAEDGEGEAEADRDLEDRPRGKAMKARQPWWPADRLVSDMALELALTVEQLGLSASPTDWDQVLLPSSGPNLWDLASPLSS